jgi:hypothetical protein
MTRAILVRAVALLAGCEENVNTHTAIRAQAQADKEG